MTRAVIVGIDRSPPPPFHFGNPGEGFEVDLLGAVAEVGGFFLRYESAPWSRLLAALREHRLDMICTAATITPERRLVVDFSRPYFDLDLVVVARQDSAIRRVRDLAGKTIGVRLATPAEEYVTQHAVPGATRVYESNAAVYAALAAGDLDAVVDDSGIAAWFAASLPGLRLACTIEGTRAQYGIVFAKGSDRLREAVDEALRQIEVNGRYATLFRKWFPG